MVKEELAEMILQGRWVLGEQLPPEQKLADTLRVSRPTLRKALPMLELEGFASLTIFKGLVKMQLRSLSVRLYWICRVCRKMQ
ncbi:MAG: winged helix-turn-helix domain-containing protein [Candidatus Wallacebacter cryptica]